jgi:signal transduction histidine kinase
VRIRLETGSDGFVLQVEDDGRGFEPAPAGDPGAGVARRGGHGLENMRQRLEDIGGRCEIRSAPGQGTTVVFTVPRSHAPN